MNQSAKIVNKKLRLFTSFLQKYWADKFVVVWSVVLPLEIEIAVGKSNIAVRGPANLSWQSDIGYRYMVISMAVIKTDDN